MIWKRSFNQGNKWRYAQVNVNTDGNYRFVIEGVCGTSFYGDIAIDEISGNTGLCPASKTCDFENEDLCGFTNYTNAKFNWLRHKGSTATKGTGPSYDHTTFSENGYYMYIQSKYPRVENDNAVLMSPLYKYTTTSTKCIELWYHAYGYDVGTLNIYKLERAGLTGNTQLLYSISGNQGNEWHITQVNVRVAANKEFNILIEGVIGENWDYYFNNPDQGDIAIDDYELKETECQPLGSCDFEQDMCAWKNDEFDAKIEWVRHKGATPTSSTGPSVDHTLGTPFGTYIYFETSFPTKTNDTARLISPVFGSKTQRYIEFYYHMKGEGYSTLNLLKKDYKSLSKGSLLWTDANNYGDQWIYHCESLPVNASTTSFYKNYVLIFQAVRGISSYDDIALDDIKVVNGELCPPAESSCPFKCQLNNQCVPERSLCNFIKDCPDGEDELQCGYDNITFENEIYGKWNISYDGSFQWMLGSDGDNFNTGPPIDHTTLSTIGTYAYVYLNYDGFLEQNAQFTSPILKDASAICQMKFWYHIKGK